MKLAFLGDLGLFGNFSLENNPNLFEYFSSLSSELKKYDHVIANLETPFTLNDKVIGGKSAYLKSHPENVKILKYLNIDYVSLANNHIYDYGEKGYQDTLSCLRDNGIKFFGVDGLTEEIIDNQNALSLHGYCCYSTNGKGLIHNEKGVVNPLAYRTIEKYLESDQLEGKYSLMSIHWGQEHVHYPNWDHMQLVRGFSEKYNFLVHGHHPHVLQGIEKYNNSLIAYSLGNAIFDDVYTSKSKQPLVSLTPANRSTGILEVEFEHNTIRNWNFIPYVFSSEQLSFDVDSSFTDNMRLWSNSLTDNKEEYVQRRNDILSSYYESRKQKRDFSWYLKRMSLNSINLLYSGYLNKLKYKHNVQDCIKQDR